MLHSSFFNPCPKFVLEYYSADWSYDEDNQPQVGPEHQVDLVAALETRYTPEQEEQLKGELMWDPKRVPSMTELASYLAKTRVSPEREVDSFRLLIQEKVTIVNLEV